MVLELGQTHLDITWQNRHYAPHQQIHRATGSRMLVCANTTLLAVLKSVGDQTS
jgi:hypothetical protein